MQKKRTGRMLCSLALSAVTLWGVSVTAPAKDARDALRTLKDETLGVMLLRYERGDGGEDFLSLRTSLALHATPLLREGEENIAQAWSTELEQKPDDSADETGDAQDSEGTVLTQEETPDEIAVTENGSPARTLKASDRSGYTVFGNVYINNGSDAALDASMLSGDYAAKLGAEGPQVLIIHTHTTEGYAESPGWRTTEESGNMIAIGDIVADALTAQGIGVIHDRELHDYPSYNGAYVRTRKSLEVYLRQYPGLRLILDLHRDAAGEGNRQMRTQATVAGEPSAQLMIVMGTNYDTYEEYLSLGLKLHTQLERMYPGITRPLQLRAARFNQDLCPGSLLIEIGAAGNTQAEAQRAANALAQAVAALALGTEAAQ